MQYLTSVLGQFGAGKTLYALELCLFLLSRYRKNKFITNLKLQPTYFLEIYRRLKLVAPRDLEIIQFSDPSFLSGYRDAVVLVDEAGIVFNSRNWKNNPVTEILCQLRKYNLHLVCTYQYPDQVDKLVREMGETFVAIQGYQTYSDSLGYPVLHFRSVLYFNRYTFDQYLSDLKIRLNPVRSRLLAYRAKFHFLILSRLKYAVLRWLCVSGFARPVSTYSLLSLYDLLFASYQTTQIL